MEYPRAPMIYVGTCGYAYRDWLGQFYPRQCPPGEYLEYYASCFPAVEIDATYYYVPKWRNIHAMNRRTPDLFRFTFKAPATVTHPPEVRTKVHEDAKLLADRLSSLRASGKLACILAQFPNAFAPSEANEQYVGKVVDAFEGIPVVAEFRRREWQSARTLGFLREIGAGYCNVDMPSYDTLMKASADVTGSIGYIRMHGRNARTWWTGTNVTRYDYEYSEQELEPWSDRIAELEAQTIQTFVFFNNHARGQSAKNARMLLSLLAERYGSEASGVVAHASETPEPLRFL
jgi:uncharacterized protein YecE (DUF72 family)